VGVFDQWFGRFFSKTRFRMLHTFGSRSTGYDREAYEHETVRAIIDAIASHTAKAEAMHVIVDRDGRVKEIKRNSPYAKLLNQRPNELMTGYDLKYKLITQVEAYTTALLYVDWDGNAPRAMYPINFRSYEFLQLEEGDWAVRFIDSTGTEYGLPLEDVVVLRKFYNERDVGGDGNGPVYGVLDMIRTAEQGMSDALHVSNKIRGILKEKGKYEQEDLRKSADAFAADLKRAAEGGGVVGMDLSSEYIPLNAAAYSLNAFQMRDIREGLYRYWRTSESILKSDYTESQWQAWYESVIEPRLIQMGQAFTNACFTRTERDHGNRIIFYSSPLLHASTQTKINIVGASREIGLFTTNELREMFGYPPVEGGDARQISLNYVKGENQDAYQEVEEEEPENGTSEEPEAAAPGG